MRVRIVLEPIIDEDATGTSIEFQALAAATLKDPEDRMAIETMIVGTLEDALRGMRQQRNFEQNKALIERERAKEPPPLLREELDCLGCRFDMADERAVRVDAEVMIRCGVCKKFRSAVYDAAGALLSPVMP
jgi:hypothetical protein